MCDLATAFSAALSLYQGFSQNQQARAQARAQENTARYNARIQENQATQVRNKGVEEENRQRRFTAELLGRQRAQLGANGVVTDSGSALQLQEDTQKLGEADALRIRGNFSDEADAIEQGAQSTLLQGLNQADQTKAAGQSALIGGVLGAGGAVASKWYSPKSSALTSTNNVNNIRGGNIHSTSYLRSQRV